MKDASMRELTQHELVGLRARVASARDPGQVSLEGLVADETRNTLVLETPGGLKVIPKMGTLFEFMPPGSPPGWPAAGLNGDVLVGRPEDRIKRNAPKGSRHRQRRRQDRSGSEGGPDPGRTAGSGGGAGAGSAVAR